MTEDFNDNDNNAYKVTLKLNNLTTVMQVDTGYFRFTRLPFGLKTASALFQQTMDKIFGDMKDVIFYIDDLLITGKNDKIHIENIKKQTHYKIVKEKWKWEAEHAKSFNEIKTLISQPPTLNYFNPNLPIGIAANASNVDLEQIKRKSSMSMRLQKWNIAMGAYDFKIIHRAGKYNTVPDCLSRLPLSVDKETIDKSTDNTKNDLWDIPINFNKVLEETYKDKEILDIIKDIRKGDSIKNKSYKNMEYELSIINNCLFKENKIVIPAGMKKTMLKELHRTLRCWKDQSISQGLYVLARYEHEYRS
ncbi:uncharacterized protein LOC135928693 [Gordionus sp. m RMFG-2023]|uniref:uncharacterized protein LOC135928693 n=1 Tax=Gordionus sp. m RMFG-2023 TaxID=3053472 RepID=UPI0031FE22FE